MHASSGAPKIEQLFRHHVTCSAAIYCKQLLLNKLKTWSLVFVLFHFIFPFPTYNKWEILPYVSYLPRVLFSFSCLWLCSQQFLAPLLCKVFRISYSLSFPSPVHILSYPCSLSLPFVFSQVGQVLRTKANRKNK